MGLLVDHAVQYVWCEPIQDRQYTIRPSRLTRDGGAFKYCRVLMEQVPLPNALNDTDRGYHHVYQLGQLKEQTFGLSINRDEWFDLNVVCETDKMSVDIYLPNGMMIPRQYCFIKINRDENIIIAVRIVPTLDLGTTMVTNKINGATSYERVTLDNTAVEIRFYQNARFQSELWKATTPFPNKPIRSKSKRMTSSSDFVQFMTEVNAIEGSYLGAGMGLYYLDGLLISKPTGWLTDYQGKVLSMIWDASIKGKFTFSLKDIPMFTSELDYMITKYILLMNNSYQTIDYCDDHDIYVTVGTGTGNAYKGVYIGRMDKTTVRMLTHNAYSLRTDIVNKLMMNHIDFQTVTRCSILLVARQGGLYRGLTSQMNRIEELYRLPRAQIIQALTGVNSSLPEWSAAVLEKGAYTRVMSSNRDQLTEEMIEEAYGYNAATRELNKVFYKAKEINGQYYIESPTPLLLVNPSSGVGERAIFNYRDGVLQRWFSDASTNGNIILSGTDKVTHAELFHTRLTNGYDNIVMYEGSLTDLVDADLDYWGFRCYASAMQDGVVNNDWRDITDIKTYYTYYPKGDTASKGVPCIRWNKAALAQANLKPCVKITSNMIVYRPTLVVDAKFPGFVSCRLMRKLKTTDTSMVPAVLSPGVIDVFLNGKSLIEGLDYFVDFPRITVTKQQEGDIKDIDLVIRYYGAANPATMQPYRNREFGFVRSGMLSADGEYDIRDDRNIRIVSNGKIMAYEDVVFAERGTGTRVTDGKPYAVTDYICQVEPYTQQNTTSFLKKARDIDDRIERYLTHFMKETPVKHPVVVDERWRIYSPFCSAVLHLMERNDYPSDIMLDNTFDVAKIDSWLTGWKYLLEYDPARREYDMDYVEILPHPHWRTMKITSKQYALVNFIIRNYLNSNVYLSKFVEIVNG